MTCSSEGKQVEEGKLWDLSSPHSSESDISPYQYITSLKVNKKFKTLFEVLATYELCLCCECSTPFAWNYGYLAWNCSIGFFLHDQL